MAGQFAIAPVRKDAQRCGIDLPIPTFLALWAACFAPLLHAARPIESLPPKKPPATGGSALPALPEEPGFDSAVDALFGGKKIADEPGVPTPEELQHLIYPDGVARLTPPSKPEPPEELISLGRKVAPAVLSLKAWDAHGNELARGCGFFIDARGAILTDMQVIHPDFAAQVEYISVSTGTGSPHRVTGYWSQDLETGLTVLQSDATNSPFLTLKPGVDFTQEQPVGIVALNERGLSLADATVRADQTQAGAGWLNLRGEDSPGEPGSPVLNKEGRVVAMVSMRVAQGKWFSFGIRTDAIVGAMKAFAAAPQPLARLARGIARPIGEDPRFIEAFQLVYDGSFIRGTSRLLVLLKTYPRSAEVWGLMGLACAKRGAREDAIACNRKAVALNPSVAQFWYQLAVAQLDGRATPNAAAREALEKTVEQRPADELAWMLLAEQQVLAEKYPEAEKSLIEVMKLEPDFTPASFLYGYAKGRQHDYAGAEAAMRRCVQLDRKHTRAWFYLALLFSKQERYDEAVRAYEEVVRLQPDHPSGWRNLALLYRKLHRDTAAQAAFAQHQRLGLAKK